MECDPSSMLALPLSSLRISMHSGTETDCLDDPSVSDSTFCCNTEDYILNIDYTQRNRRRRNTRVARSEKPTKDVSPSTSKSPRHRRGSVSEKISMYESLDTTVRDNSQTIPSLETARQGKRSISDRLALFENNNLSQAQDDAKRVARSRRFSTGMPLHIRSKQASSSVSSPECESRKRGSEDGKPAQATNLSPSKTARFVKRGKVWEKTEVNELEDQKVFTQYEGTLDSPRRKPLPDTLKPAFNVFENAHSNKQQQELRLCSVPFLHSPERNTADHGTTIDHCSVPFINLVPNDETPSSSPRQGDQQACVQSQGPSIASPRRKPLPESLKPAFNVFENACSRRSEQEHQFIFLHLSHKRNVSNRLTKRNKVPFHRTFKPFSDFAPNNESSCSPQLGDQHIHSQAQWPLVSPRRKPVPDTLKPAFEVFESTHSSRPEQDLRLCSVPLLNSPERNTADRFKKRIETGINLCSIPFTDLVQHNETTSSSPQLGDQQIHSQPEWPLISPRRKPIPETLKPAFDHFESTDSSRHEQELRLCAVPILCSPERNTADRFKKRIGTSSILRPAPFSDLDLDKETAKTLPQQCSELQQKLQQLGSLAEEEKAVKESLATHATKAKRRNSVGNGVTHGETVDEKMRGIDMIFNLHHEVKGTEVGTLIAMQEQVKAAHRENFEREIWEEKKIKIVEQYKKKIAIERLQREIARAKVEVEALMNNAVVKVDTTYAQQENIETNFPERFDDSFQLDSGEEMTLLELISCSDFHYSEGGSSNALLLSQRLLSYTNDSGPLKTTDVFSQHSYRDESSLAGIFDDPPTIIPYLRASTEHALDLASKDERTHTRCNAPEILNGFPRKDDCSFRPENDPDDESVDCSDTMKKVDRLLAKSSKYLGKGSSSAHSSPVRKGGRSKKVKGVTSDTDAKHAKEMQKSGGEDYLAECREIFSRNQACFVECKERERLFGKESDEKRKVLIRKISDAQSEAKNLIIASNSRGRRASMSLAFAV